MLTRQREDSSGTGKDQDKPVLLLFLRLVCLFHCTAALISVFSKHDFSTKINLSTPYMTPL